MSDLRRMRLARAVALLLTLIVLALVASVAVTTIYDRHAAGPFHPNVRLDTSQVVTVGTLTPVSR